MVGERDGVEELRTSLEAHERRLAQCLRQRRGDHPANRDEEEEDVAEHEVQEARLTLFRKVEDALRQLEVGGYGCCSECEQAIAAIRLCAMPFATRCRDCEDRHETALRRERLSQRKPRFP